MLARERLQACKKPRYLWKSLPITVGKAVAVAFVIDVIYIFGRVIYRNI